MTAHYWSECPMCGPMVVCGKCGNNACNAGYGTLIDGSPCDACPSAYDKQKAEYAIEGRKLWRRAYHFWRTIPWRVKTAWMNATYRFQL